MCSFMSSLPRSPFATPRDIFRNAIAIRALKHTAASVKGEMRSF